MDENVRYELDGKTYKRCPVCEGYDWNPCGPCDDLGMVEVED